MASWKDGPEYAPAERPVRFDEPEAAPLEVVKPVAAGSAGAPTERPRFDDPGRATPLDTLAPAEPTPRRDPMSPFDVPSATMAPQFGSLLHGTEPSAWGAAHWSPPQQVGAGWPHPAVAAPPARWPAVPSWPEPDGPDPLPVPAGTNSPAFPAPGTPAWFGPGPRPLLPADEPVTAKAVVAALTPGVLGTLALGIVWPLAPFTLCLAFLLSSRTTAARPQVQRAFLLALTVLGFISVVAALANLGTFSDWWSVVSRWALVVSAGMTVVAPVLVRRELLARAGRRQPWS